MPTRTTRTLGRPGFVVDHNSVMTGNGRQIDWANVPDSFKDAVTGKKFLKAGTVMHELTAGAVGKLIPRDADHAGNFLLISDAYEGSKTDSLSGYGVYAGGYFYENLLPQATGNPRTIGNTIKNELGATFRWDTYQDIR